MLTKEEAINTIRQGDTIVCGKDEWPEIRSALQEQAGKSIDAGDILRAIIALEEIRRLDKKFGGAS